MMLVGQRNKHGIGHLAPSRRWMSTIAVIIKRQLLFNMYHSNGTRWSQYNPILANPTQLFHPIQTPSYPTFDPRWSSTSRCGECRRRRRLRRAFRRPHGASGTRVCFTTSPPPFSSKFHFPSPSRSLSIHSQSCVSFFLVVPAAGRFPGESGPIDAGPGRQHAAAEWRGLCT